MWKTFFIRTIELEEKPISKWMEYFVVYFK